MSILGGLRGGSGGGASRRRPLLLATVAAVLIGLTIYDYMPARKAKPAAPATAVASSAPAVTAIPASAVAAASAPAGTKPAAPTTDKPRSPWQEFVELRHFRDNAALIRQRYKSVAVPYAESVATFATLYTPDASLKEQATRAIRSLVPTQVEVRDLLVAESGAPVGHGIVWLTATVSLASGNAHAMNEAVLALGDAASGMVWKELSLAADPERRQVRATGQLALLMLSHAE